MNLGYALHEFWMSTGLMNFTGGQIIMILVGLTLLYLAINKGFEPLLLVPIGFGAILSNIPLAEIANADVNGFIGLLYEMGVETGLFPLLIFMGVGAMTDFGRSSRTPRPCSSEPLHSSVFSVHCSVR